MYIERKTTVEKHQNSGAAFFMERLFGRFDQSIACFYGIYGTEIIFFGQERPNHHWMLYDFLWFRTRGCHTL